ncbi:MAG: gamma-glutamyl-gamma-aminobutyrate hydrolase family protein [Coprococcus sp.]
MRPVIGLSPLYDETKESYWMLPGYMKVLEKCGAMPIMLPLTSDEEEISQILEMCDGLLLTGGHDVNPAIYHEYMKDTCGVPCNERDLMESLLFGRALEKKMPVLGICRGIQFMNAYLGGTLYQDINTEYDSRIEHHMTPPYDREVHKVTVMEDTLLADILGAGVMPVNSYHHQAIKKIAPGVSQMAVSEDGLVEAISVDGQRFAIGVQWHPEFSYESDDNSIKLVQAFVDACR